MLNLKLYNGISGKLNRKFKNLSEHLKLHKGTFGKVKSTKSYCTRIARLYKSLVKRSQRPAAESGEMPQGQVRCSAEVP